jgi:hypothetical protein
MNIGPMMMGAGIGAGLMFLLDPRSGRRRRALMRDQMIHLRHEAEEAVDVASRDLMNRTGGMLAEAKSKFRHDEPTDEVLMARVRADMGRHVSHPAAIEVEAMDGMVTLTGQILEEELDDLMKACRRVPGVRSVMNRLETHAEPGSVPGLQGPGHRASEHRTWKPATRLLAGTTAAGAVIAAGATALSMRRGDHGDNGNMHN